MDLEDLEFKLMIEVVIILPKTPEDERSFCRNLR